MEIARLTKSRLTNCSAACLALLLCTLPGICAAQELLPAAPQPPAPVELSPTSPVSPDAPFTTFLPDGEIQVGNDEFQGGTADERPAGDPTWAFGYKLRQSSTSWLVGGGDDLGNFSLESLPTLASGQRSGIVTGTGFHFLGGPLLTDLPPRLFDFQIGYQTRKWLSPEFGYDVSARVGAFSDFEGSAREGIRFPAHAVGYFRWSPDVNLVFGLDYLDRDDIHMLPVLGLIYAPRDDLRLELVFPHPRVELQLSPKNSIYVAGELGGGTWAIERANQTNDVTTYRDLRLLFGVATREEKGDVWGFEIGYIFARDLSYRSHVTDYLPADTLLIRSTHLY